MWSTWLVDCDPCAMHNAPCIHHVLILCNYREAKQQPGALTWMPSCSLESCTGSEI